MSSSASSSELVFLLSQSSSWTKWAWLALLSLVVVWASLFWGTWAHWGNVTIDSGREVYVPAQLAENGKTLYKDIWYLYGPAGPYFNALLFQIFGARLETAYWAGSLAALGSAVFVFLAGKQAGVMPSGWTAGMLVLMQAFVPSLFCFPYPYSFAAVYGCLVSCAFLWISVLLMTDPSARRLWWMFAAGLLASVAYLLKLEFGMALYGGLAVLMAYRAWDRRSWRVVLWDAAAAIPGVAVALAVTVWMVRLGGLDFLLHENIMSWPTAYFMREYGKAWLKHTMAGGTAETPLQFLAVLGSYLLFWFTVRLCVIAVLSRKWIEVASLVLLAGLFGFGYFLSAAVAFKTQDLAYWLAMPKYMPVLVVIGMVGCARAWLQGDNGRLPSIAMAVSIFALLLCFRLAIGVQAFGQSIYYNAPIFLVFLPMLAWYVTPGVGDHRSRRFAVSQLVVGMVTVGIVGATLAPMYGAAQRDFAELTTSRGRIFMPASQAEGYKEALQWLAAAKAEGKPVLSVPEDTSLYFLAGITSPTRVFAFTPGILAPGKMTETFLDEVSRKGVTHVLWSNRTFGEYGVTNFGTDFDRPVGDYFRANFEPTEVRLPKTGDDKGWYATVWKRRAGGARADTQSEESKRGQFQPSPARLSTAMSLTAPRVAAPKDRP